MQDRYLFRGQRIDNRKWAYGYYANDYPDTERTIIICNDEDSEYGGLYYITVNPATVGQCTGLHADKSYRGESEADRLTFVDDIVRECTNIAIIKFGYYTANNNKSYCNEEAYGFYLEFISHPGIIDHISDFGCWEIIGNVHDGTPTTDRLG